MPRVQTFLNNQILEEINEIIQQRKQEGALNQEANLSGITSMLVELGLRVYRLQQQKNEESFNQMEFNKILLENVVKSRLASQKLLATMTLISDIQSSYKFDLTKISSDISSNTDLIINNLFPVVDKDSELNTNKKWSE